MYQQHSFEDSEGLLGNVTGLTQLKSMSKNNAKAIGKAAKKATKKARKKIKKKINDAPENIIKGAKKYQKKRIEVTEKFKRKNIKGYAKLADKTKPKKSLFGGFFSKKEPVKDEESDNESDNESNNESDNESDNESEEQKPKKKKKKKKKAKAKKKSRRPVRSRRSVRSRRPVRRVVRRYHAHSTNPDELKRLLENQEEMLRALRGNFKQQVLDMYDKIENEIQSIRKHFHIERDERHRRKRQEEEDELDELNDEENSI